MTRPKTRGHSAVDPVPLRISNRDARRLWLAAQGLGDTPTGKLDLDRIIKSIGFVQLDTIQVVSRAHHHILWSRNQNYREPMLNRHMQTQRLVFEHFTHDASVIPMDFYPMWRRQFRRMKKIIRDRQWYRSMSNSAGRKAIKERIQDEGPLSTHAFNSKVRGKKEMWSRPPHKMALDYMWYTGELSTAYRQNFTKFYDLTERVIPDEYLQCAVPDQTQVDWLCTAALDRLAFGTVGEIQRFWDATDSNEVKGWVLKQSCDLVQVEVECADGTWRQALATPDIETRLQKTPMPTSRLRILNPFDPVIRDRVRLLRLFGFEYVVEMFVPAAKRRWGYYVYPLLEGNRFVGRIEIKGDRKAGELNVLNLWPEPKVRWTKVRSEKLNAELYRLARLVGCDTVTWAS
ncbi:MAG: crosslink repair DNA glycosylase YcaQ family protein [Pseudomonadota bacterium]